MNIFYQTSSKDRLLDIMSNFFLNEKIYLKLVHKKIIGKKIRVRESDNIDVYYSLSLPSYFIFVTCVENTFCH